MTMASSTAAPLDAPLAGLRVLDIGFLYAAPLIATFLADQGAEVVKIEPPTGDLYRSWDAMWAIVGRRKRSVTLDLSSSEGRALLLRLVREVDVVVENMPRRLGEQRGLTPEALRAVKSSLVVVSASGFGPTGPYADRPANGTVAEAFSGLTGLTGAAGGRPYLPSAPLGDGVAAAFGAMGALAGVIRALRTGHGAIVDVTVHEPLLHMLGTTLSSHRPGDAPPGRDGGAMGVPLRGTFRTSDDEWVAISASMPRHQQAVAELVGGMPETSLRRRVETWVAGRQRAAVVEALAAALVPAGPVNNLDELHADPQIAHRASLANLGGHTIVAPTPHIDGATETAWLPDLGEANEEILGGWIGVDGDERRALRDRRVIGPITAEPTT